ncbi:MAG TPA: methyltransferase domain-containing protein [Lysobacter sp.]|nr:methyltransferase domain-containing protein [Lysobacter sp.]
MTGYATRTLQLDVGGHAYRLRVLADLQQFHDPDGEAERLGISSAQWSLFGQVWPAGHSLAEAMHMFEIDGKRILELGCGIGLASLVLQRRGADVVASDMHPLAGAFLAYNAALNALPAVAYRQMDWHQPQPELGRFDAIIASDVLYEAEQVRLVSDVIDRHAYANAEVVITDPGRGNSARLTSALAQQGFDVEAMRTPATHEPTGRGRTLHYRRTGHA